MINEELQKKITDSVNETFKAAFEFLDDKKSETPKEKQKSETHEELSPAVKRWVDDKKSDPLAGKKI
jgi:hypothetical protein